MTTKQVTACIEMITSAVNMYDLCEVEKWFDHLNGLFGDSLDYMDEPPENYIQVLVMLEDLFVLSEPKTNATANFFYYMREKIMSHTIKYENLIMEFRENPMSSGDDEDAKKQYFHSDSDSDSGWDSEDECLYCQPQGPEWEKERGNLIKFMNKGNITWKRVCRKYVTTRMREGKGYLQVMERLAFLARVATTPSQKLQILRSLVESRFGVMPGGNMAINVWMKCMLNIFDILDILNQYPNVFLDHNADLVCNTREEAESQEEIRVYGRLSNMCLQLNAQFYNLLKSIKHDNEAYYDILSCESMLYVLSQHVRKYLEAQGYYKKAAKVALKEMELLYYKSKESYDDMCTLSEIEPHAMNNLLLEDQWLPPPFIAIVDPVSRKPSLPDNIGTLMDELNAFIHKYGDQKTKSHAMLFDIYHQAIVDRFTDLTKLPSMNNLWSQGQNADYTTEILFNRAKAQLGLCAFKIGRLKKAHSFLSDIFASEHSVEELLAQGVSESGFRTRTSKQERLERRRQLPYHMHMNLQILKAVHLICNILVEEVNMTKSLDPQGKEFIRERYCGLLQMSETKSLSGDKIREEALNIYLLTCSTFDKSLTVDKLSTLFALSEAHICRIMNSTGLQRLHRLSIDTKDATVGSSSGQQGKVQREVRRGRRRFQN